MAHGQVIRSCGTPSPLSIKGAVAPAGGGYVEVVPSICVSERYDSNVFYVPPTPGLQRADFVTNVSPMLGVNHNGDYASGFLNVAGISETYMDNPGLNFLGSAGYLSLNLDNSIKKVLPNASLSITDAFTYTPLPPGFVNPVAGTSPGAPGNIQNIYAQGFLAFRTNNLVNNGTVSTSYATTASTALSASYSNAIIRFGAAPSTAQGSTLGGLFDTTTQTGTVGGIDRLSELDTLNVKYSHSISEYTTSSTSTSLKSDIATFGWSRTLSSNLSAEMGGGGIVIPGLTTYAANAALIMNYPNNRATFSFSRSAFPSFAVTPIILIGNVFSLSAVQRVSQQWQLAEAVVVSRSAGDSGPQSLAFDSYYAAADIYYWVTRIWSTALSFDYLKFHSEVGSFRSDFDRMALTLSVRAMWD